MSIMALNHSELLCRIGVFFGEEEEGTCYVLNRSENVPCMCIAMIWKSMLLSYFPKKIRMNNSWVQGHNAGMPCTIHLARSIGILRM